MDSKTMKLRDEKVLRNFLNLKDEARKAHLDLITHLNMLESIIKDGKNFIDKQNLPRYSDIRKHNLIHGSHNSKYLTFNGN